MSPTAQPTDRWTMTRRECLGGIGKPVPDLLSDELRVLFVGINPSTCSGARGLRFATPGNRFWPTLHRSGFTDRELRPDERGELIARGLGITNLVNRATASAAEVDDEELVAGAHRLREILQRTQPRSVAILGKGAFETGFRTKGVLIGPQENRLEGVPLWILPNPSGLNAHYTVDRLAEQYARLLATIS